MGDFARLLEETTADVARIGRAGGGEVLAAGSARAEATFGQGADIAVWVVTGVESGEDAGRAPELQEEARQESQQDA